jgi:hypothetical protein
MPDLRDPLAGLAILAAVVLDTLVLGVALMFFQGGGPAPESVGAEPTGRREDGSFFAQWGPGMGWTVCFLVMAGGTTISFFPFGPLLGTVGWWVAALTLFGLTVRQTIKLNIAFGLMYVLLLVAITAVAARS